jgi:hypothetical protein
MPIRALNPRKNSLVRGTALVLGSLALALWLAFPNDNPSLKLLIPTVLASIGSWDTTRCLQRRWSFYHGGVILLLYMDVMALAMILFLLLFPYARLWLL